MPPTRAGTRSGRRQSWPGSPFLIRRTKPRQWLWLNSSTVPDRQPESLTSTDDFHVATSTQSAPPPLALLLRQIGAEERFG